MKNLGAFLLCRLSTYAFQCVALALDVFWVWLGSGCAVGTEATVLRLVVVAKQRR